MYSLALGIAHDWPSAQLDVSLCEFAPQMMSDADANAVRLAMLPIRWCPRWLQLFQGCVLCQESHPSNICRRPRMERWLLGWEPSLASLASLYECRVSKSHRSQLALAEPMIAVRPWHLKMKSLFWSTHSICPLLSGLGGWALLPQIDPVLGQWLWKPIGSCRFIWFSRCRSDDLLPTVKLSDRGWMFLTMSPLLLVPQQNGLGDHCSGIILWYHLDSVIVDTNQTHCYLMRSTHVVRPSIIIENKHIPVIPGGSPLGSIPCHWLVVSR